MKLITLINKFNLKLIIVILLSFLMFACVSEDEIATAKLITIELIENDPNFYWYSTEYSRYKVNPYYIEAIIDLFDEYDLWFDKLVIYTSPSCLCGSDYIKFPQLMKVLSLTNFPTDQYELYITKNESTNFAHPYSELITVPYMPSFYVVDINNNFHLMPTAKETPVEQSLFNTLKYVKNSFP